MDTKKLRQKILDLAIRGKLVPQDPNDEPASVLLERIRAEKEQLIKEGKIKRSKKSAATDKSHYENVPFEIPESWVWTSIGELFEHNTGKALNASNRDGKMMDYITTSNLYWDRFDLSVVKQMLFTEEELWRCTAKKGDLLICEGGDIGRAAIWNYDYDIRIQNHIHRLRGYKGINHRFYYFVFLLYKLSNRIGGKGVAIQGLSSGDLHKLEVPLPPEYEQIRLVKTIEKWFKFVDLLEQEQENLHTLVQSTKSKILDLAISGKLVPQDPNDEPAIELLKRINPDFQSCDNSHYENIEFDIPQNWVWATIGDIFEHNTGKALNASNPNGTMLDYITTSNLYWDRFELSIIKQMPFTESEIERCIVRKGDLLICEGGDVGRAAIWDYDYNIMIQNHIHRLRGKVDICTRYFFYLFMHYKLHNLIGGKGVAIQGLSSRDLHNLIIPVPSLKEQYDIASSIDLYFSKLDMITAEL